MRGIEAEFCCGGGSCYASSGLEVPYFLAYVMAYANNGPAAMAERHVKLFKNGRNQAVRIPREFELPGEDAIMRKEGGRLVIEPAPPRSLLKLLETLATLDEEFPQITDAPPEAVEL